VTDYQIGARQSLSLNERPWLGARTVVDEPAVVIMSVQDFIRTVAPPPDWLEKAWSGAKRRGLDTLMPADIEAEIVSHRRKPGRFTPGGVKRSER
jgi:hypothetical protein